jgi:hypothetical protein
VSLWVLDELEFIHYKMMFGFSGQNESVESNFNNHKVTSGLSLVIFEKCKNMELIFRAMYNDPVIRDALISDFPIFKDHAPDSNDMIILEKSFDARISRILEKDLKVQDCFDQFFQALHSAQPCRSSCLFHKSFPTILKKSKCSCGLMQSEPFSETFGFNINLSRLLVPESYLKHRFKDFGVTEMIEMAYLSTSKLGKVNLDNLLKKKLEKQTKCKMNPECQLMSSVKCKLNREAESFCIRFDWKLKDRLSKNILQVISMIKAVLNLSDIVTNSNKTLYLHSIIATDKSNNSKIFQINQKKWVQINNNNSFILNKGRLFDLAYYLIYKLFFPDIIFYSSSPQQDSEVSIIELSYLERLSYMQGDKDFESTLSDEWEKAQNISKVVQLEFEVECQFCYSQKALGEPCLICDFLEGQWTCNHCRFFNKPMAWTCARCKKDRIQSRMFEFSCQGCGRESVGVNYCRYCPSSIKCKKCKAEIMPYMAVYCVPCGVFKTGVSECFFDGHPAECDLCRSA